MKRLILILLLIPALAFSQTTTFKNIKADTIKAKGTRLYMEDTTVFGTRTLTGKQILNVDGAIKIGASAKMTPGTIQYKNGKFWGYGVSDSTRLDSLGGGGGYDRNVKAYGATGDGSTDDFQAIQDCFDVGSGYIVIGQSLADTFMLSQPIWVEDLDGLTIELNGVIKMQDGHTSDLTANTAETNAYVLVAKADSPNYSVGQWVALLDDDCRTQGGGTGQTRRQGPPFVITEIIAGVTYDSIYFDRPIGLHATDASQVLTDNFLVSENAVIGHVPSVFAFERCNNITITGYGVIDLNGSTQLDTEMLGLRQGACIFAGDTTLGEAITTNYFNFKISDVTLKNSFVHNLSICHYDSIYIDNVKFENVHDKHILWYYGNYLRANHSEFNYSEYEDGIQSYVGCNDLEVKNCTFIDLPREAIGDCPNRVISDCRFIRCYQQFNVQSKETYNNIYINNPQLKRHLPGTLDGAIYILASSTVDVVDVVFNNLIIDSCLANHGILIRSDGDGEISNIIFNGGRITSDVDSTRYGAQFRAAATDTIYNIFFNNFTFSNLAVAIYRYDATTISVLANTNYVSCSFIDNTLPINGSVSAEMNFIGSIGLSTEIYQDATGKITLPEIGNSTLKIGSCYINSDATASEGLQVTDGITKSTSGFQLPANGYLYFNNATTNYLRDNGGVITLVNGTSNLDTRFYYNFGGVKAYFEADGATGKLRIGNNITTAASRTGLADVEMIGSASVSGEFTTNNSFGEMHSSSASVTTVSATKYYTLVAWTAGSYNEATLNTDSTIAVTQAGTYYLSFAMSASHASATTTVHLCAFNSTDNTELTNMETQCLFKNAGEVYQLKGAGLVVLTAGEKVSLRVKADNNAGLTPVHTTFTIFRIK